MKRLLFFILTTTLLVGCTQQVITPNNDSLAFLEPDEQVEYLMEEELGYSIDDLDPNSYNTLIQCFKEADETFNEDTEDFKEYQIRTASAYSLLRDQGYQVPIKNLFDAANQLKSQITEDEYNQILKVTKLDLDVLDDETYEKQIDSLNKIFHKYGLEAKYILDELYDEAFILSIYDVNNTTLTKDNLDCVIDTNEDPSFDESNQFIFDSITNILPKKYMDMVTLYTIASDGMSGTLAYTKKEEDGTFLLSVDPIDILDENNEITDDAKWTIIHESGHIMSLNDSQMSFDEKDDSNYSVVEGTFNKHSYMHEFYNQFWKTIIDESEQCEGDEDKQNEFYKKYKDQFVTDYAATDPLEDFAECYAVFVLKDKPTTNTIADQKIQFFYDHKDLVDCRNYIRKQLNLD